MQQDKWDFWARITRKISEHSDYALLAPEILEDLCNFFDFGCGFFYQTLNGVQFTLDGSFVKYEGYQMIPQVLDLDAQLGPELQAQLLETSAISFRAHTRISPLEKRLSAVLGMRSLVFVPVCDPEGRLAVLLGIGDRRGEMRFKQEDMVLTESVLIQLSTLVNQRIRQKRLEAVNDALERIMNNMGVDVYVNDYETHEIIYVNDSMAQPYGGVEQLFGQPCWRALYQGQIGPCDFCPKERLLDENGLPVKGGYTWNYQRPFDGAWFRVNNSVIRWMNGRMAHVVSSVDITENYRREELIRKMAEYDTLTGLPNRYRMVLDLDTLLVENGDREEGYVIFFDLDGFKTVNDTLGHHAGDVLLTAVGRELMENPLTRDRCYRYGGDEFVILWDTVHQGHIRLLLDFLLNRFAKPWAVEEHTVACGVSVGVSHYPHDAVVAADLVRKADQAMYQSKARRKGEVMFYNKGDFCLTRDYLKGII